MTNLENVLHKLATNAQVQSHLNKAREAYKQKPFALEHRASYESICAYRWIPSMLSILSSSLVAITVFPSMPIWLSLSIGLVIALGLEILKGFTTEIGFRHWFKSKKFSLILVASISLYVCSIALSSLGSYNGYQLIETNMKEDVSGKVTTLSDSLSISYQNSISQATKNAEDYFNSVSWKGKISHKNAVTYNLLLEKIGRLESQYIAEKKAIEVDGKSRVLESSQKLKPYLFILVFVSLLNELVIFFFARFKEYYLFKSNQQVEQITHSETLTINLDSIGSIAELLHRNPATQIAVTGENETRIGFDLSTTQTSAKTPVQSNRSTTVNKLQPRKCVNCGDIYKPSVAWQKYCRKECNHQSNNFKLKE